MHTIHCDNGCAIFFEHTALNVFNLTIEDEVGSVVLDIGSPTFYHLLQAVENRRSYLAEVVGLSVFRKCAMYLREQI